MIIDNLETHHILIEGEKSYTAGVKQELLTMSAATIDRYLKDAKARDKLRGISTTKPGSLLRNSVVVRKAGDEVEQEPGFFECDTVAHCGPTLVGEFARSVNFTDVYTGWVYTISIRNNAHTHMIRALNSVWEEIPYPVIGLDCDNGSEFINTSVIAWAKDKNIYFTRSRPYKKNDQATIESKNHHVVRKYGWHYRYDTQEELQTLNIMWKAVNDRCNYFTPTKKPIGYTSDQVGRRKRVWDGPKTPFERLRESGILTDEQESELTAYRDTLNIAQLAKIIDDCAQKLLYFSKNKTQALEDKHTKKIPDIDKGIKIKA